MTTSSLHESFSKSAALPAPRKPKKNPPPFYIRFTKAERTLLKRDAGRRSLSSYIRFKLFGDDATPRKAQSVRKKRQPTMDAQTVPRFLGTLGQSELAMSMLMLSMAAQSGSLPVTPELEEKLHTACDDILGFVSRYVMGALNEAYGISRGTKCDKFLYSLSFNPPPEETVSIADFESAFEKAEQRLGLTAQPRVIVFHEKEGRRHAHVVWSRINIKEMKAVQMSFDHERLKVLSRELFI